MELFRPQVAILTAVGFAAAVTIALWKMQRLGLRAQFLVLVAMGVSIGFVLMTVLQVPEFPHWLAVLMVLVVFIAAPFATRIFMRSLKQDEERARER
jgi:ABC-type iron transport system FetAB permease component